MTEKYSFKSISNARNIIMGFATILVVLFHSQDLYIENIFNVELIKNILLFIKNLGNVGVDVFLILSGVGLYYSFTKNGNIKLFYKRRATRIFPAVIIVAIITTALGTGKGLGNFFQKIFLVSFFTKGDLTFWYFSLIIVLYLVYPFLHKLIAKYDYKAMLVLIVSIMIINCLVRKYSIGLYKNVEIALTRIPVFIIGIWLGKNSINDKKISKKWLLLFLMIFSTIIGLLYNKIFNNHYYMVRYLYGYLALSMVILLSYICTKVKNTNWLSKSLVWTGNYSMEIYLLYEYLVKNCTKIFKYKDEYNMSYHLCIFLVTLILANGLKKFYTEIMTIYEK